MLCLARSIFAVLLSLPRDLQIRFGRVANQHLVPDDDVFSSILRREDDEPLSHVLLVLEHCPLGHLLRLEAGEGLARRTTLAVELQKIKNVKNCP